MDEEELVRRMMEEGADEERAREQAAIAVGNLTPVDMAGPGAEDDAWDGTTPSATERAAVAGAAGTQRATSSEG